VVCEFSPNFAENVGLLSIVVVYKKELELYNPDYESSFFSKKNRTIVDNFEGEIEYKKVPIVINGYEDTDTIISGQGNKSFKSCYEEDLT